MSKYTTEVRYICETAAGLENSEGYLSVNEIITRAIPNVFNFDFPIFDESYRNVLARKILKHFYTREIGEETVGLWKLRLDTKLNEIMPFFNKLYLSELLEFNPLYTTDLTRKKDNQIDGEKNETINTTKESENVNNFDNSTESEYENSSSGTGSGTNTNETVDKFSDTPQGSITNLDNGTYLTNARITNDSASNSSQTANSGSGNSSINGNGNSTTNVNESSAVSSENTTSTTEDYLEHVVGYESRSGSKLLKEYRETFLNIDMMVIEELEPLFMQLW